MICVPSVMILAIILESIPWCHLVVGILLLGFEPEIHPTCFMLIVFARSFRSLATFAIVLEVRGISFFQILWTTLWQKFVGSKDHNRSALVEFSILYCDSASSTFLHGLSGRNMWDSFDMLNHASTTYKVICSFELSLFSCLLTFVYQLIVQGYACIRLSMPITHVVRQAILSWMTWRNKLQYLIHIQDWVKEVVLRRSNC